MNDKTGGKQGELVAETKIKRNPDGTFPKGKTGNPKGRPRERSLTTQLKDALKEREKKTGKPYDELLVNRLLERAISVGDMKAIQMIWERLEGKPKQTHEHSGVDGDPIEHTHKVEKLRLEITRMNNEWFEADEDEDEEADSEQIEGA